MPGGSLHKADQANGTRAKMAIAPGSLVVVTGANGNVGSHIVDQLLFCGYHVRGTVRDVAKNQWLKDMFESRYGAEIFELVEVSDMAIPGAFDAAAKGAAGFVHTATPVFVSADPDEVIPGVVDGTIYALEAAAKTPGLTRFVLTSSSGACLTPKANRPVTITAKTWNEDAVKAAYTPPPDASITTRKMDVYYASKTKGEQAAWAWAREQSKAPFVLNTVLPNTCFGPVLSAKHQGYHGTQAWIRALYNSGIEPVPSDIACMPPQYFVDIRDIASLHVAALIYEDVRDERVFGFAYRYTFDDILASIRKIDPARQLSAGFPEQGHDLTVVPNERAQALLERVTGGRGWRTLEETVRDVVKGY